VKLDAEDFRMLVTGGLQLEKALTTDAVNMQHRRRLHLMAYDDLGPFEVVIKER
jgi:hypothetical protein